MADEQQIEQEAVPSGPTARVADSYGDNPNEHKPSQDPWDPDTADDKQAATGGVDVREEESSAGSSSSTPTSSSESSSPKSRNSDSRPAPAAESPTGQGPKGSSTARSTERKPGK